MNMNQGIQISESIGKILINIYYPELKPAEAAATFEATKMALFPDGVPQPKEEVPFVTNPKTETLAPPYPATPPQIGFCAGCGAKKDKLIPAGVSKAGKAYGAFYVCPNGCKSK